MSVILEGIAFICIGIAGYSAGYASYQRGYDDALMRVHFLRRWRLIEAKLLDSPAKRGYSHSTR